MIVELAIESHILDASVQHLGRMASSESEGMSRRDSGWDDEE